MIENSAGWRYVQSADPLADFPAVSEHNAGKFQDLKSIVEGKAPLTHTHPQSQVTGLDAALAGKAPLSHTHTQSQVTGLDTALAGKAPVSHTHSTSQVTGLDTALAGKAPLSHTHTQSQVTGLDTALAGKAPLATLNTRVPENLALRLDTTVGTRIFAGNTMIHGDTGWRTLVSWDNTGSITYGTMPTGMAAASGRSGGILIRRVRERVTMAISGAITTSSGGVIDIPTGFFPTSAPYPTTLFTTSTGVGSVNIGGGKAYTIWVTGAQIPSSSSSIYAAIITWDIFNTWPTSLPGTPA